NGFNNNWTGFGNGDFDYNGIVDFDDYSIIDQAFNTQSRPARSNPSPAPVFGRSKIGRLV
ncbi:MAG: hypothetical protein H7Z14_00350, partial [Anaerolineae bacterium]|nr:hypothetical protein [Phycisphaerae bacterium]